MIDLVMSVMNMIVDAVEYLASNLWVGFELHGGNNVEAEEGMIVVWATRKDEQVRHPQLRRNLRLCARMERRMSYLLSRVERIGVPGEGGRNSRPKFLDEGLDDTDYQ
jgi:hypothetical protein